MMRKCKDCGETKPLTEFNVTGATRTYRRRSCNACLAPARREANREWARHYRATHGDEYRASRRKWYREHSEARIEAARHWQREHRDEWNAYQRAYRARKRAEAEAAL